MIRINQIGYQPDAVKICVLDHPEQPEFQVETIDEGLLWKKIYASPLVPQGSVFIGDFSCIHAPADYRIRCGEEISTNFVIKKNPYNHLERLLTEFYTWERCGSTKGWTGVCHQEPDRLYGTDRKLDMRGGYHQSGDLRCWHDGCSSALYGYMRFAEAGKPVWENGIFDEELKWGVDYFRKTVSPEGFIYDCQFIPLGWGPRDYYNSPAPLSDHYNICRLLARASVWFRKKDPQYAAECLVLARKIWEYVEKSHAFDVPYEPPVTDLPRGTQPASFYWQNRKGCAGMDCASSAAAYDLCKASGELSFRDRAYEDMRKVLDLQITSGDASGLFRDSLKTDRLAFQDCGYGHMHSKIVYLVDLIREQPDAPDLPRWKRALELYCDMMIREFGHHDRTEYPPCVLGANFLGDFPKAEPFRESPIPLVHATSTSTGNMAIHSLIFAAAAKILGRKEYPAYSQRCLDFLLGDNPLCASCITGIGFHHPRHNVFGQFFPSTPQIPGGMTHCLPGEYDLPAAGVLLRALLEFRD